MSLYLIRYVSLCLSLLLVIGLASCKNPNPNPNSTHQHHSTDSNHQTQDSSKLPRLIQTEGEIENFYQISSDLYSGGEPYSPEAFALLKKHNIKSILTVDAAIPQVELARKHGIRYIQIPIGYDGIATDTANEIAQAFELAPKPMYVHCHHGKHRGPTACMVIGVAHYNWTEQQAVKWLHDAGTAEAYKGLYQTARDFKKKDYQPNRRKLLKDFPETAKVDQLPRAMADMGRIYDLLKKHNRNNEILKFDQAILLQEAFHEMQRTAFNQKQPQDYRDWMKASEEISIELRAALDKKDATLGSKLYQALASTCKKCHLKYRD